MNSPSVDVEITAISRALIERASEAGLGSIAEDLADCIILSHLARFPRIDVIQEALTDFDQIDRLSVTPTFTPARRGSVASEVDCQGLPAIAALDGVVTRISQSMVSQGIALLSIRNTGGMHTLDVWARLLARRQFIGIVGWNGGPYAVVPTGSIEPFFGTNPLAFGLPLPHGEPIVGDFATSEIAYMDLTRARRDALEIPKNSGLTSNGELSTNAELVYVAPDSARLLPMGGGPKGSALMLLVEALTGAFVGGLMGRRASPVHIPSEFAGFVLAIAADLFRPPGVFESELGALVEEIRASTPRVPGKSVRLPGDAAESLLVEARHNGHITCSSDTPAMLFKH